MQAYQVHRDFEDPDYPPEQGIVLRSGDVVELDDATANHVNRKQVGTLSPYFGERDLSAAPHDRMMRGKDRRGKGDDSTSPFLVDGSEQAKANPNIGVMASLDNIFKAAKGTLGQGENEE